MITKLLPDGTVNVPDIVIVPTAIAFLPDAIDMFVNVCGLVIKNVDDKLDDVIVATDDVKIHEEVKSFGGKVIMTNNKHHNGTERCYEALQKISERLVKLANKVGKMQ